MKAKQLVLFLFCLLVCSVYSQSVDTDVLINESNFNSDTIKNRLERLNKKTPIELYFTPSVEKTIKRYLKTRVNFYKKNIEKREFQRKNQYCNFIYSNPAIQSSIRNNFFNFLSNKRFIHSAGKYANNIGGAVKDKLDYIKNFVFTIAFENSYSDYYTTEKLLEPLLATSIPIYWGGQESLKHFNSNTLINAYGRSFEEIENEMNELLEDKDRIIEMCTLPIFEKFPEEFLPETIATKIMDILKI